LFLLGCAPDAAPQLGDAGAERVVRTTAFGPIRTRLPQGQVDAPIPPDLGEYRERWVGIVEPQLPCPDADPNTPYLVEPLFDGQQVPGLARYCLYRLPQGTTTNQPPFANPGSANIVVGPDHSVVVPSGNGLNRLYAASYADMFLEQGGRVPDLTPDAPRTRVAIVDSAPTAPPGVVRRGYNLHGYNLGRLNRALSCDLDGDCVGRVSTRLALDLRYVNGTGIVEDRVNGGDFGSLLRLAQVIVEEVDAWQADPNTDRLVINLSLGWNPLYGGDGVNPLAWPADVRAVYQAILHARCQGALVVAAAGNASGGAHADATGPLYPGGWERVRSVESRCQGHFLAPPPLSVAPTAPLVVAAGAVDEDGLLLANARPGSMPLLAAYGSHGTRVDATSPFNHTLPMTGTSVSAAVVSAAAAAIWDNVPMVPTDEIHLLLSDAGPSTGFDIDVCPGGAAFCGESRRVEVCPTVNHLCSATPYAGSCQRLSDTTCLGKATRPATAAFAQAAWERRSPRIDLTAADTFSAPGVCNGNILWGRAPVWQGEPCPDQWHYFVEEVLPSVEPQPHDTACPVCFLETGSGLIYLEQDRTFADVDSLTLHLQDHLGNKTDFTTRAILAGEVATFKIDPTITRNTVSASVSAVTSETTYLSVLDVLP
jgi:hypothetical protein